MLKKISFWLLIFNLQFQQILSKQYFVKDDFSSSSYKIPSNIKVAGVNLFITSKAKKNISKKIDSLVRHEQSLKDLLIRVRLYMPIIEEVLKRERMPLDFRYIPIQESGMKADATESDSLGFWQLKVPAASEVNLIMNENIDERAHIVASTVGAVEYLKWNNNIFQNWVVSLLAYNRGMGWAIRNGFKDFANAKRMKIDANTHWYLFHFIAHKIVFGRFLKRPYKNKIVLYRAHNLQGRSLDFVANRYRVSKTNLIQHNLWLKSPKIPSNKNYFVFIPIKKNSKRKTFSKTGIKKAGYKKNQNFRKKLKRKTKR